MDRSAKPDGMPPIIGATLIYAMADVAAAAPVAALPVLASLPVGLAPTTAPRSYCWSRVSWRRSRADLGAAAALQVASHVG